jgi:hypothetical protein
MAGELRQVAAHHVVDVVLVRVREHCLAERGRVQWQQRSHLQHLETRVRTEHVVDDEDAVAVGHPHADGLADACREQLRPGERARPQLVQVEVAVPELEELGAELVLVRVEVLLDEPVLLQGSEQAVHGRLRESHPVGEIAEAEAAGMLAERLEDADRAVHGLNRLRSYCRIPFDIVECSAWWKATAPSP